MRVWTNGRTHLVADPRGLTIAEGGGPPVLRALDLGSNAQPEGAWPRRRILSATPTGARAFVGTIGGPAASVCVESAADGPTAVEGRILDLCAIDEQRVLAVVLTGPDKRPSVRIVMGPPPVGGAAWPPAIELPRTPKVDWPDAAIWTRAPWSKRGTLGFEVTLASSPYGTALAERDSGVVAVLRPGESAFAFGLRVPTTEEATLSALPTAEGVLVVVCIGGRESAVVHFDPEGRPIASTRRLADQACWNMGPPAPLGPSRVGVVSAQVSPTLFILELPDLREVERVRLGHDVTGEQSACGSVTGDACVLGLGSQACVVQATRRGWDVRTLVAPRTASHKPSRPPPSSQRVEGAPVLTMVPQRDAVRVWTGRCGSTLELEVVFASVGGPGRGVFFELSGPWIASSRLRAIDVRLGTAVAPFRAVAPGVLRAELDSVELPAAIVSVDGKRGTPVSSAVFATVRLEPTSVGVDLLGLRIGPISVKSQGSGSFLYTKRLEVEGAAAEMS